MNLRITDDHSLNQSLLLNKNNTTSPRQLVNEDPPYLHGYDVTWSLLIPSSNQSSVSNNVYSNKPYIHTKMEMNWLIKAKLGEEDYFKSIGLGPKDNYRNVILYVQTWKENSLVINADVITYEENGYVFARWSQRVEPLSPSLSEGIDNVLFVLEYDILNAIQNECFRTADQLQKEEYYATDISYCQQSFQAPTVNAWRIPVYDVSYTFVLPSDRIESTNGIIRETQFERPWSYLSYPRIDIEKYDMDAIPNCITTSNYDRVGFECDELDTSTAASPPRPYFTWAVYDPENVISNCVDSCYSETTVASSSTSLIAILVGSIVGGVLLLACAGYCIWKRQAAKEKYPQQQHNQQQGSSPSSTVPTATVVQSTYAPGYNTNGTIPEATVVENPFSTMPPRRNRFGV